MQSSEEEARNKLVIFVVCTLHQVQEMLHLINIFSFSTFLKLILKLRTTKENDVCCVFVYFVISKVSMDCQAIKLKSTRERPSQTIFAS